MLLYSSQGKALSDQQRLRRPCAAIPNGTGGKGHCPEKRYPAKPKSPKKLTRAQKKEIDAVLRKYKGDGKPRTAQATIPYEAIYPDGVCRIDRRTFSKCIAFEDISYQLAQPETRTAIFEHLCDLYNYVDASIHVQLSFLNRKVDPVQYAKSFEIAPQG